MVFAFYGLAWTLSVKGKTKVSRNAFHSVDMVLALAKNNIVEVLLHNEIQVFFLCDYLIISMF